MCCHNDEVPRNLDHLIGCVKFCGVFDLALQDMDKSNGASNPGIFCGLVDSGGFSFTSHLVGAMLLEFYWHLTTFPEEALNTTVREHPMLNKISGIKFISSMKGAAVELWPGSTEL